MPFLIEDNTAVLNGINTATCSKSVLHYIVYYRKRTD